MLCSIASRVNRLEATRPAVFAHFAVTKIALNARENSDKVVLDTLTQGKRAATLWSKLARFVPKKWGPIEKTGLFSVFFALISFTENYYLERERALSRISEPSLL